MKALLYTILCILVSIALYKNHSLINIVMVVIVGLAIMLYEYHRQNNGLLETFTETEETSVTQHENYDNMYSNRDKFVDINFTEDMEKLTSIFNNYRNELVFYVSTFDGRFVDFGNKALKNKMNTDQVFQLTETNEMSTLYHQSMGVRVTNLVNLPSAKETFDNISTFTTFMYIKFDTAQVRKHFKEGGNNAFSLFKFDHHNVITNKMNYDLFDIVIRFEGPALEDYNPRIQLYFADEKMDREYIYDTNDFFTDKMFTDNRFHLLTFVKGNPDNENADEELYIYLDDKRLLHCTTCSLSEFETYNSDNMEIRNTPIRMNDQSVRQKNKTVKEPLEFKISALGIMRSKSLTATEVTNLSNYFKLIENHMSPDIQEIIQEKRACENELRTKTEYVERMIKTECPFPPDICESVECKYINNWDNINEIVDTPLCFQKLISYCDSKTDPLGEKEWLCKYLKSDNINKMATNIANMPAGLTSQSGSASTAGGNTCSNTNSANEENANGNVSIKDIHLDKTYRNANGKYDSEMHRIVQNMIKQNGGVIDPNLVRTLRTTHNVGDLSPDRDDSGIVDVSTLLNHSDESEAQSAPTIAPAAPAPSPSGDASLDHLRTMVHQANSVDLDQTFDANNPYNRLLEKYEAKKNESNGFFSKLLNGWF